MKAIHLQTTRTAIPRCYCYSTPTVPDHKGWVKIGYTEQEDVEDRINQQLRTANIPHKTEWSDIAIFSDGKTYFHDTDFHAYLQKQGIERMKPLSGDKKMPEWFKISGEESMMQFMKFRQNRGILQSVEVIPYVLRDEQSKAIEQTLTYFKSHQNSEFLWNAKPRFGKTLATYDLCKRLKENQGERACNILIVTNRPAIANSWYEDYEKFLGTQSGFRFVSEVSALKGKSYVMSREQYTNSLNDKLMDCIEFVSLQDLKGSLHFGGHINKLREVKDMQWELLVIDEAHEGVDTMKTDIAFNQIKRKYTLHLSGTPFKALANDKFPSDAIYNWTYSDEQRAKRDWNYINGNNPYESLPKLNLFTYQMSEIIHEELSHGIEIKGETEEYAFDLNQFFATKTNGEFVHNESVNRFLDALTKQEKFPFSTNELREELKHTLWLLDRVDSAKALAKKLKNHPIFCKYGIILAAGDGKLSKDEENKKSYDKVVDAIKKYDKTITLSVGQLTTGITVKEWTAVLMLSNCKSPSIYIQTAFRSQNPWQYQENGKLHIKENAYVFDFDPARTLIIFEEFANDLSRNTSSGKSDSDLKKQNVRELLNFFPVIGEDEQGEMIELDAEKVLSIPRKIRSLEVVRRGFMSNFLFQNISNIFGAPQEVLDIISSLPNAPEGDLVDVSPQTREDLSVNEDGNVELSNEFVIGKTQDIFGDRIYGNISDTFEQKTEEILSSATSEQKQIEHLERVFYEEIVTPVMDITNQTYGADLKSKEAKKLKKDLEQKVDKMITQEIGNFSIEKNNIENNRKEALAKLESSDKSEEEINEEYNALLEKVNQDFKQRISEKVEESVPKMCEEVVKTVETQKREHKKETIEDAVRVHMRGFARTIPSFLMAYGDENTTLENFDMIIPDDVFIEVTSISLDEFRLLRDGGSYNDKDTGKEKRYEGNLFDPVVFNDSIKEFLTLKENLSNYFDKNQNEDIFDYIPPQKTNQIYTPKTVVKQMVDMLQEENPYCFDDPNKTFLDAYMKSGLYIAEIVTRLYNSDGLKQAFPNDSERLKHIFEKQVYGLAPTEIIYQIALHFILGFDKKGIVVKHNIRQVDTLKFVKNGTMNSEMQKLFDL